MRPDDKDYKARALAAERKVRWLAAALAVCGVALILSGLLLNR